MGNRSGTRCQTKLERRLTEILRGELASHGISVRRWKRSNAGEADFELSMIDIPRPRTPYALGVAFHEMGHIHHCRNNGRYSHIHNNANGKRMFRNINRCCYYRESYT